MIPFLKENEYDLGIVDRNGNPVTSRSTIVCKKEHAPQCKLWDSKEFIAQGVEQITIAVVDIQPGFRLLCKTTWQDSEGKGVKIKLYNGEDDLYSEDISVDNLSLNVSYFGKKGEVQL